MASCFGSCEDFLEPPNEKFMDGSNCGNFNGIWFARNSQLHGDLLVPFCTMFSFISQSISEANKVQPGVMDNTVS